MINKNYPDIFKKQIHITPFYHPQRKSSFPTILPKPKPTFILNLPKITIINQIQQKRQIHPINYESNFFNQNIRIQQILKKKQKQNYEIKYKYTPSTITANTQIEICSNCKHMNIEKQIRKAVELELARITQSKRNKLSIYNQTINIILISQFQQQTQQQQKTDYESKQKNDQVWKIIQKLERQSNSNSLYNMFIPQIKQMPNINQQIIEVQDEGNKSQQNQKQKLSNEIYMSHHLICNTANIKIFQQNKYNQGLFPSYQQQHYHCSNNQSQDF